MSTYYGDQYQDAFVTVPSKKIKGKDFNGSVRRLYFSFTVPSVAPANGDKVKLGKLPAGARIMNAGLQFPDLGAAGAVNLGWAASSSGAVVADADALLVNVDVATAADAVSMQIQMEASGANAGYLMELSEEVDLELDIATAWTAVAGTIKGFVEYTHE